MLDQRAQKSLFLQLLVSPGMSIGELNAVSSFIIV